MTTKLSPLSVLNRRSQTAVLRFLWKSRVEWGGREIARQTGLSAPACNQALKLLAAAGLVLFRRVSNSHLYKINSDNYLLDKVFAPLFQAEAALLRRECNAAGLNAVHCAISAADALTVFHAGVRSAGEAHHDAAKKPGQTWEPSGETCFRLPVGQELRYAAPDRTVSADAWGLGYRFLGSREGVSRTAGFQLQRLSVSAAAGRSGKVKPVLGLRLGFAFPGFWLTK